MTRPPAGFYPANQLFRHVTMAGAAIYCAGCEMHGKLPLPRDPGYSAAVEDFVERHRLCQVARIPSDPSFREPDRGIS